MNVGNFEEEEIIEEFQPVASIVLSDDTKIRGVSWGDFKEEAMILDFEPSNFFFQLRNEEKELLERLILA